MKKNILITILLFAVVFGGCYMYAENHMSEDEIHNVMRYIPFKEKKSIKRDSSKKHKKKEAERSDADNKNVPESIKKKSKAKETTTVESHKCKYCGDTIYYIIEDEEYGINGDICWDCYWNKLMDIIFGPIEEDVDEPDINDTNDDINDDTETQTECSICGGHVGIKEMCECDGTIHHRTCHVDAYTCPSCGRYGLNNDPDIYGCPYCGYPDEDYDMEDYEEDNYYDNTEEEPEEYDEYDEEEDTTDDDGEDIHG